MGGYINVVENEDGYLTFSNLGSFIPGNIERVIHEDAPEEHYRNPFLAAAMFNLKMVDTIGSGIKRMFNYQRQRFFPMPDYQFADNKVVVKVTGKVIDLQYARVLAQIPSLTLSEIMMLDKVQKKISLTDWEINKLREKKLIEGRKPNFFISVTVAKITGQKAAYTRNKGFNKEYYHDLILKAVKEHKNLGRTDIEDLIWEKLPDIYDDRQKKVKINNLIAELSRNGKIRNEGSDNKPVWVLNY